jgi:hypothetical protein
MIISTYAITFEATLDILAYASLFRTSFLASQTCQAKTARTVALMLDSLFMNSKIHCLVLHKSFLDNFRGKASFTRSQTPLANA